MYVNDDTYVLSEDALRGVDTLLNSARKIGLLPETTEEWLFSCPVNA